MAKLGDLIVRIGADTKDLNKQLGRVQREMRSMTGNLTQLGQNLTRAITVPLAGLGALAVKSAADLEKLEASFVSLTGGVDQAAAMMKQLNEFTASTPFQIENVANAARQLIASGTEIGEVNNQLRFLGDIAATSGVTIEEIAAIFAKVNAKGKVELENLNQLAERGIPIFKALADATGLPADSLGAGAVSVKQFNDVLKSFAEEGGFAAGAMERLSQTAAGKFSTALDNLKLAGAEIGKEFLPKINELLDRVVSLSQAFSRLSPEMKSLIVNFSLLSGSIGPVLVGLPSIVQHMKSLGKIIQFGGIGVAAAAFAAIAVTIVSLRKETVTISDRLDKAQKKANTEAAKAITNVRVLVDEYKKERTSLERKEEILSTLKTINKDYFGDLKAAITTVDDLTKATNDYVASIKEQSRQKALMDAQQEQLNAVAKEQKRLLDLERERITVLDRLGLTMENMGSPHAQVEAIERLGGFFGPGARLVADLNLLNTKIKVSGERIDTMVNDLHDFALAYDLTVQPVERTTKAIDDSNTVIEDTRNNVFWLLVQLNQMDSIKVDSLLRMLEGVKVKLQEVGDVAKETGNEIESAIQNAVSDSLVALGEGIGKLLSGGLQGVNLMAGALMQLGNLMKSIGKAMVAQATAMITFQKTLFKNPYLAAAAGVAFIAAGALLSNYATNLQEMPALAEGGLAYGATTAIVGDNPNARIDPEVIAPLSKLQDMMGGQRVEVFGRISGDDIYLSNARTSRNRNRYS
jgi:tape measure domain-containing protein